MMLHLSERAKNACVYSVLHVSAQCGFGQRVCFDRSVVLPSVLMHRCIHLYTDTHVHTYTHTYTHTHTHSHKFSHKHKHPPTLFVTSLFELPGFLEEQQMWTHVGLDCSLSITASQHSALLKNPYPYVAF